jgi:microcystin-dependent protein
MSNYEATRYDFNGAGLTGIQGVNTGLIVPWSDASLPTGFLECAGAAVSRSTYSDLFSVIGTTYGSGDGSSTFNLPNLEDKVVLGRSPGNALASTGGANTVSSSGNISSSVGNTTLAVPEIPAHSHPSGDTTTVTYGRNGLGAAISMTITGAPSNPLSTQNEGGGGAHTHNSNVAFSGTASSVLQPYLTIKYIIKT